MPPDTPVEDEFSAAFADLTTPASVKPAAPAAEPSAAAPAADPAAPAASASATPTPAQAPAVPAAEDTPATPAAPAEPAAPAAPAPAAEPAAPAAPVAAPVAAPAAAPVASGPSAEELQAQLAALTQQLEEIKKVPTPAAPEPPLYTAEEMEGLAKYREEWPDIAKNEQLMRRAEYKELISYVFGQIRPHIDELRAYYESTHQDTQYASIVRLVPDYDQVRDATLEWVEKQPAYLKAAYQQVTESGSPSEVADLITRFKKETGYVAPAAVDKPVAGGGAAAAPAPAASTGGAAPIPPAAAAAAASLRAVQSGRSEPVSAPDPNDFDGAFKEFASR